MFRPSLKRMSDYSNWTKEQLIQKISELEKPVKQRKVRPSRPFDFNKFNTRFIALRFSYLGWNYNGLAVQKEPTPLPTIEGVLIEALNKCKLVPSFNPSDFKFSRCGRTDRGVSALNQVVSLRVRSNLTEEEQLLKENDSKEISYLNILNNLLPNDIKIHSVCLRPGKEFDARFSCTSRHYKYLFHKKDLNIEAMQRGARSYLGEHDFRNFCKLDGSKQIKNYNRSILKSEINKINDEFYVFDLQGSAFLWHQVRNMISILFLIGQNLESETIISELLNVELYPTKPIFDMSNDTPLILYDCTFPEMEWIEAEDCFKSERTIQSIYSNFIDLSIKSQINKYMLELFPKVKNDINEHRIRVNLGDGKGKVLSEYVPLKKRERMENFEVVNERWLKKKKTSKTVE